MSETVGKQEAVIACDLTVFTPEQIRQHRVTCDTIFADVREVRDLPTGYAFRLPESSSLLPVLADFIAAERRCCPFVTFDVHVESYGGAIWLHLTGPDGYKRTIARTCARLDNVVAAAGLS